MTYKWGKIQIHANHGNIVKTYTWFKNTKINVLTENSFRSFFCWAISPQQFKPIRTYKQKYHNVEFTYLKINYISFISLYRSIWLSCTFYFFAQNKQSKTLKLDVGFKSINQLLDLTFVEGASSIMLVLIDMIIFLRFPSDLQELLSNIAHTCRKYTIKQT